MSELNEYIEKLAQLTGKAVELTESEITKQLMKRFYGVSADFEKDLKRLINFYETNVQTHPELKQILKRVKRLQIAFETIFETTEKYIHSQDAETNVVNQPELPFQETYKGMSPLKIGDQTQVYPKGEAFIGKLIAYGKVTDIDYDHENQPVITFDTPDSENIQYYSAQEYDIVKVDLENPDWQKIYGAQRTLASTPTSLNEGPKEELNQIATQCKKYIDTIHMYVQPSEKDVAQSRKNIYNEFLNILKRYDKELPGNNLDVPKEVLMGLNAELLTQLNQELESFIKVYEIPYEA